MRRLRPVGFPFAILTLLALLAACGGGGGEGTTAGPAAPAVDTGETAAEGPIVIGLAAPFTQANAQFGEQMRRGAMIARDEINAAGGINGREVSIIEADDEGNASAASTVARDLAQNPNVAAVVGHFNSSCSLNGLEIYSEAGVVMFSPASTNSTICESSPWAFRNIFTDKIQGQTLAQYAHEKLGFETIGVLYENDDYGRGLYEHMREEAESIGLEISNAAAYDNTTGDFVTLVRSVSSDEPDAIIISGLYAQAARIAQVRQELGIDIPLIASDGVFSDEYMALAGDAAEGTLITTPFLFQLAGDSAEGFVTEYSERWPDQEPDAWAALAYDAFHMVCWAIEQAGTDRTAIRDFLAGVDTPEEAYAGMTGTTYFNEHGDCRKPIQVAIVEDGKFAPAPQQL